MVLDTFTYVSVPVIEIVVAVTAAIVLVPSSVPPDPDITQVDPTWYLVAASGIVSTMVVVPVILVVVVAVSQVVDADSVIVATDDNQDAADTAYVVDSRPSSLFSIWLNAP